MESFKNYTDAVDYAIEESNRLGGAFEVRRNKLFKIYCVSRVGNREARSSRFLVIRPGEPRVERTQEAKDRLNKLAWEE
jgi:hypothetical protein